MALFDLSSLALILGAMARGPTRALAPPGPGQVQLARVLSALGATMRDDGAGCWLVHGTGVGGWREPGSVLELGQITDAVPLMAGAMSTLPFTAILAADSGDAACSMISQRAILERIGARLVLGRGDRLPGALTGAAWPLPGSHDGVAGLEAVGILLAGLNAPGKTGVPAAGLDGAIALMRRFGAVIEVVDGRAWVAGHPDLLGVDLTV